MTSAKFFFLMCLANLAQPATMEFSPSLNRKTNFILVKPGQNLTLPCHDKDDVSTRIYWFNQVPGQKPKLICSYYILAQRWAFFNDFKTNPRFQIHPGNKGANLTISDLELSDSATYYCVNQYLYVFDFREGYKVIVEGSGLTIDQSASQSIQAGGSVTLNCTVHTGWTCDGDHTVYWFRNSGQSQLGLMYSHTGRNKQCERKTNTCLYSFPMKNLNTSQTGTYYCAVAACGHILFGDGTKPDINNYKDLQVLVFLLCGASSFSTILVVCMAFSVCMMNNGHCEESDERLLPLSRLKDCPDADGSVLWKKMNREHTWTECVYFSVKQ
ncbi:uncharacterized protein LOC130522986 isoform X1 [Takifugu flavidus]|uniref:uncharacterized protein LOC130522986 isoform X1 n=2 Tax=Takifugu flavidus TaxID=433684 RepID=UPI002544A647|nr:uncharacterized protein LOC130522986 isoform X1 [Takifugu flavidus]